MKDDFINIMITNTIAAFNGYDDATIITSKKYTKAHDLKDRQDSTLYSNFNNYSSTSQNIGRTNRINSDFDYNFYSRPST
ncbi:unnamed protein product, partial [marine sediment metagenome]